MTDVIFGPNYRVPCDMITMKARSKPIAQDVEPNDEDVDAMLLKYSPKIIFEGKNGARETLTSGGWKHEQR